MKTPKSPQWKRSLAEDGSLDYHLKVKRPYDLHFSVWINPPEGKWRHIDLAAWVGPEDEPTYSETQKVPASWSIQQVLELVPGWQETVVRETANELWERAAFLNTLERSLR